MKTAILLMPLFLALPAIARASCDCYAHLYSGQEVLVKAGLGNQAACQAFIDDLEDSSDTDYTPAPPVCKPTGTTDYACPKYTLQCDLQKLNANHAFATVKTLSASFVAFNWDEPSEAPNTCEASLFFPAADTGLGVSYHATVKESLDAFLYVGVDYGAKDPQFELSAVPGKPFTLFNDKQQMVCVLK